MAFTDVTTGARIILEGNNPVKITLGGDCKTGDLLGYSTGWKQADADNTIYPRLVAGETAENGEIITAYSSARIGGITTGVAGADLYLSDTAGGYHHTASSTISQRVGFELGSSEMFACPRDYIDFRAGSTLPALTLGGNIAAGDVSWTGVGDMTFTAGSIIAAGSVNTNTLLFKAGGISTGTTFITLTAGATDECELEAITMKGTWLADGTVTFPVITLGAGAVLTTAQAFNCGTTEDHYYDLNAYDLNGTAYISAMRIQNANSAAAPIEIGFFGKTPVYKRDHISDATGSAGTAINHIIDCLEEFGFAATS